MDLWTNSGPQSRKHFLYNKMHANVWRQLVAISMTEVLLVPGGQWPGLLLSVLESTARVLHKKELYSLNSSHTSVVMF